MKLKLGDFERGGTGLRTRYVARLADSAGARDYELILAGPRPVLDRIFGESEFDIEIDPKRSFAATPPEQYREAAEERLRAYRSVSSLDDVTLFFKKRPEPKSPTPRTTAFVSLRRVRGEGTFWGPWSFNYFLPHWWSFWISPPPFCFLFAAVQPTSGDQDLYLYRAIWWGYVLADRSINGGTARDMVSFSNPPLTPCNVGSWNYAWIQTYGYAAGFGSFSYRGFS